MGRFYETTFYDTPRFMAHLDGPLVIGWQVLASPITINGQSIPYKRLLLDFGRAQELDNADLARALQFVGDPTSPWNDPHRPFRVESAEDIAIPTPFTEPRQARAIREHVESLAEQPFFAAELSPLRARSLGELAGLATTSVLVALGDLPAIVLIGEVGLVVVRPLAAVSKALWEGARPEFIEFGGDTAATLLDSLRRRLGIERRKANEPS